MNIKRSTRAVNAPINGPDQPLKRVVLVCEASLGPASFGFFVAKTRLPEGEVQSVITMDLFDRTLLYSSPTLKLALDRLIRTLAENSVLEFFSRRIKLTEEKKS